MLFDKFTNPRVDALPARDLRARSELLSPSSTPLSRRDTYTNLIVPGNFANPWVLEFNDNYYLLVTTGSDVQVRMSLTLASFDVDPVVVYTPPAPYTDVWRPSCIRSMAYSTSTSQMDTDGDNDDHRMYVLQVSDPNDPTAPFELVGQITTPDDNWLDDPSNTLWQNLYIAEMDTPTSLTGERVLLHQPTPSWQQTVDSEGTHGVNEGPEILVMRLLNAGRTFLIYSAAGSWTSDYCLATMGIDGGADPMVASNWWTLDTRPVMWSSDVALGPGHASFPYDHDSVPYVVYHAMDTADGGWADRTIRTQSYGWNPDNSPSLPTLVALGVALPSPA